jgi:hypothetical protein
MTSVSVLDGAFDRVSALEHRPPSYFVNHAPMACEALEALGFESTIDDWAGRFLESMREEVGPVSPDWSAHFDWESRFGDSRLLPQWMGFFQRAIADDGWPAVVGLWVPRLTPGLVAALFHGVIRTAHAVRAIDAADTPARRAELARALGHWATWFAPGQAVDRSGGDDDPVLAAIELAASGAGAYVADPNIFYLHGVTGAMAVQLLAGHLPAADAARAVVQMDAEHRSLYRGVSAIDDTDGATPWSGDLAGMASASYDPHQVKLVEACRRGFEITGDRTFVVAAETVTGLQSMRDTA